VKTERIMELAGKGEKITAKSIAGVQKDNMGNAAEIES